LALCRVTDLRSRPDSKSSLVDTEVRVVEFLCVASRTCGEGRMAGTFLRQAPATRLSLATASAAPMETCPRRRMSHVSPICSLRCSCAQGPQISDSASSNRSRIALGLFKLRLAISAPQRTLRGARHSGLSPNKQPTEAGSTGATQALRARLSISQARFDASFSCLPSENPTFPVPFGVHLSCWAAKSLLFVSALASK
jgi:hypothetical protein